MEKETQIQKLEKLVGDIKNQLTAILEEKGFNKLGICKDIEKKKLIQEILDLI